MSFHWDWLLNTLITTGITDYYQINVCDNHSDIILYKLGRGRGPLLTEVHIIQRTSPSCYRVSSFDFDNCQYKSFKNVMEVCDYIRTVYIPKDCHLPSVHERLQAKRKQRAELALKEGSAAVGFLDGERANTLESTLAYEDFHRRKLKYYKLKR